MDNNYTLYMHINKVNGKKYIGITKQNPFKRWGNNGCKYKPSYFRNAINKYGWDNFIHEIIFTGLSEFDAKYLERLLIKCFDTKMPNGYNMTDGGDGTVGYLQSEQSKQKASESSKQRWRDKEFSEKMIAIRNDPKGPYQSDSFKNKISMLVRGENNPNYNHKWNDTQKHELSKKQKNNPIYKNENNPNAKPIRCIETGEIFPCMKYAQLRYGLKSTGSFTAAIKRNKTAAGLHWEYV